MKFKKLLLTSIISSQMLFSAVAMAGPKRLKKMNIEQFRLEVEKRCLETADCNLSDANMMIDQIEFNHQNKVVENSIKTDLKGNKIDPIEVIRRIQLAGVKIVKVTIKAGGKVITVITDGLDSINDLPDVRDAIKNGAKTIEYIVEGTYNGVKKITKVTVKTLKKLGLVKPIKIIFITTFRVIEHIAKGTIEVVKAVLELRPLVIIIDGIEYILKVTPIKVIVDGLGDIFETTWDITMEVTEVFFKGAWRVAQYTAKGAMFILGLPVYLFKIIFGL